MHMLLVIGCGCRVLKPDTGLCGTVPQGLEGKVQSAEYSREWQSYSFEEVDSLGPC